MMLRRLIYFVSCNAKYLLFRVFFFLPPFLRCATYMRNAVFLYRESDVNNFRKIAFDVGNVSL